MCQGVPEKAGEEGGVGQSSTARLQGARALIAAQTKDTVNRIYTVSKSQNTPTGSSMRKKRKTSSEIGDRPATERRASGLLQCGTGAQLGCTGGSCRS